MDYCIATLSCFTFRYMYMCINKYEENMKL